MMCVNCNKEVKDDKYKRCIKCGFSICSECSDDSILELCSSCVNELYELR